MTPIDFTASVSRFAHGHERVCWLDHRHSNCIDAGCWQVERRTGEIFKVRPDEYVS